MRHESIEIRGETYNVGDEIVYNDIISFCNEFNSKIVGVETRKNCRNAFLILADPDRYEGRKNKRIKDYMVIRKGNDGSGVDLYYN